MKNFSEATPENIKQATSSKNFLKVLDELLAYKQFVLSEQETFLNPATLTNGRAFQLFLKETTGIDASAGLPRAVYENMTLNARNLFALKGSPAGLKLFARCACLGDIMIKSGRFYPESFIILSDYVVGYLPNGDDLGKHPTNTADSKDFIWLYGGNTEDYYQNVELMVVSPYFSLAGFREWFLKVLPMFLPMVDPNTSTIKVMMYSHDYLGVPFSYNSNLS